MMSVSRVELRLILACVEWIERSDYSLYEEIKKEEHLMYCLCDVMLTRQLYRHFFITTKEGHELGYEYCTDRLARCYFYDIGCTKNALQGALLVVRFKLKNLLKSRILQYDKMESVERYVYGQYTAVLLDFEIDTEFLKSWKQLYDTVTEKARQSALCCIWFLKKEHFCSPDIARLIAKMVYQSRYEPDIWER